MGLQVEVPFSSEMTEQEMNENVFKSAMTALTAELLAAMRRKDDVSMSQKDAGGVKEYVFKVTPKKEGG